MQQASVWDAQGLACPLCSQGRLAPQTPASLEAALPPVSAFPQRPQVADLSHLLADWVQGQELMSIGNELISFSEGMVK